MKSLNNPSTAFWKFLIFFLINKSFGLYLGKNYFSDRENQFKILNEHGSKAGFLINRSDSPTQDMKSQAQIGYSMISQTLSKLCFDHKHGKPFHLIKDNTSEIEITATSFNKKYAL